MAFYFFALTKVPGKNSRNAMRLILFLPDKKQQLKFFPSLL